MQHLNLLIKGMLLNHSLKNAENNRIWLWRTTFVGLEKCVIRQTATLSWPQTSINIKNPRHTPLSPCLGNPDNLYGVTILTVRGPKLGERLPAVTPQTIPIGAARKP